MANNSVTPQSSRWRKLVIGLIVITVVLVAGAIWTKLSIRDDDNVTASERENLSERLSDTQTISLGLIFPVIETRLVQFETTLGGERASAYAAEYYTLFNILQKRTDLECWDFRPGIDGVMIGEVDPIGTRTGSIWCDGIIF